MTREAQRADLHKTIWRIANDLRGSVDGLGLQAIRARVLFYRFISENLVAYLNEHEHKAGESEFDYGGLDDEAAEFGRAETVSEKGFYILPSELFVNVRHAARNDENLNETLEPLASQQEGPHRGVRRVAVCHCGGRCRVGGVRGGQASRGARSHSVFSCTRTPNDGAPGWIREISMPGSLHPMSRAAEHAGPLASAASGALSATLEECSWCGGRRSCVTA